MTSEPGWTVTPAPIEGDVATVVEAADEHERKHWRIDEHLDDRSKAALLELAKAVV